MIPFVNESSNITLSHLYSGYLHWVELEALYTLYSPHLIFLCVKGQNIVQLKVILSAQYCDLCITDRSYKSYDLPLSIKIEAERRSKVEIYELPFNLFTIDMGLSIKPLQAI